MAVRGKLHVIGIDLSTAQIGLARKNAIEDGFAEVCQYEVGNLASLSLAGSRESHCVMIHAILHHLTWREISTVLEQVSALGKGASVFVYEPVRLTSPRGEKSLAFKIARRLGRYAVIYLPRFSSWLLCNWGGKRDDALGQKLELLNRLARENGWELSPKEVVFSEEELVGMLSKYFEIKEVRVCNYLSIIIGQQAGLYRSQFVSTIFANVLLPIARVVDSLLFKIGALPFLVDGHVFLGYSCRVK